MRLPFALIFIAMSDLPENQAPILPLVILLVVFIGSCVVLPFYLMGRSEAKRLRCPECRKPGGLVLVRKELLNRTEESQWLTRRDEIQNAQRQIVGYVQREEVGTVPKEHYAMHYKCKFCRRSTVKREAQIFGSRVDS